MKNSFLIALSAVLVLAASGCQEKTSQVTEAEKPAAQQPASQAKSGKVVETMNAGGYTYVQVDTGSEKIWAAAPEFAVKVGDPVVVPEGMAMNNYHSKSLNRDFELVYFVDSVLVGGSMPAAATPGQMPAGHPPVTADAKQQGVDVSGVKKAEGGKTIEEIFASKGELSGKEVTLRAKVVKFSPQIMGKNWMHLQDGTGAAGTNDLTVTSAETAQVGDTVLVKGILATNKDFGYGYNYDVILEDAKVKVE